MCNLKQLYRVFNQNGLCYYNHRACELREETIQCIQGRIQAGSLAGVEKTMDDFGRAYLDDFSGVSAESGRTWRQKTA